MKKVLILILLLTSIVLMLTSCNTCWFFGCTPSENKKITSPTCTKSGWVDTQCKKCGEWFTEKQLPKSHSVGEWKIIKESTCIEKGVKQQCCTVCNETVNTESLEYAEHTQGEWKTVVKPTCTAKGQKTLNCKICEFEMERVFIDKVSHVESEDWVVTKKETCTNNGLREKRCKNCTYVFAEEKIEAHHTVVPMEKVEPSCTSVGLTEGSKCSACDAVFTEQQEIPKIDHDFQHIDAVPPTCSEYGREEGNRCSAYSTWEVEPAQIEKLSHTTVIDPYVDPTCEADGKTEGMHCSVCEEVIEPQEAIKMLGHDFSIYTNTCSRCPEKEYTEIRSRNDFLEQGGKIDSVVYLDYCVNVSNSNEGWRPTIEPDVKYVRLVGTAGVTYNVKLEIANRTEPIRIDLVNASITTFVDEPIINSPSKADVHIGFYGTECRIIGKTGTKGANGTNGIGTNLIGKNGGNGSVGIQCSGDLSLYMASNNAYITGGNGGDGGNGGTGSIVADNGGKGGNGGNGAYAIFANTITVQFENGYSQQNINILGGTAGNGGAGGKKSNFLYKDGAPGKSGSSSVATNTPIDYK